MLKGKTKIELTDVNTGEKQVIEKENMITNAIPEILSLNPWGFRYSNFSNTTITVSSVETKMGSEFATYAFPIYNNLIGGILLYGNKLEENPAKYFAGMDNPLIGYSSNDVNTGEDAKRGSMNQTESGLLEDGNGYRYVFDFETSQGNGVISSLGLTSSRAGKAGYGSDYDSMNYNTLLVYNYSSSASSISLNSNRLMSIVSIDAENNIEYFARITGENTIEVGKFRIPLTGVRLMDKKPSTSNEPIYVTTITTTNFCSVYKTSNLNYATLIDGGDGYIWGFQHENNADGNSSGSANVLWIKISKSDFSFTEGTWTINATLLRFGSYNVSSYGSDQINYAIIKDGILYAIKYTSDSYMDGVYAIPLDNPTDVTLISSSIGRFAFNPVVTHNSETHCYSTAVNDVAGVITYRYMYIMNGELHKRIEATPSNANYTEFGVLSCGIKPSLIIGPYLLCIGGSRYSGYSSTSYYTKMTVNLMSCYLATINNLEEPVTKTASQTMKITYTITEE